MTSTTAVAVATARRGPTGPQRLLVDGARTIGAHLRRHGPLPDLSGVQIRAIVGDAGLTGRGGAGFPTHRKLDAVAAGTRTVVIANAAEGEPASSKDRHLLTYVPHLVLDGLFLAARAVGADESHIYVPASVVDAVHMALAERREGLPVTVHIAPDAFVVGEESAVVSAVGGGRPIPQDKAVRIIERGLRGRPTLVQNVETLAHLALIARYGARWFRSLGTQAEPGTFLGTVSGAVASPGVYELPYGARLGDLLGVGGGVTESIQAVLIGGYHGAWIPPDSEIPISRAGLDRYGATPGAGIAYVLPDGVCGLATTADLVSYLAGESAGQCGPCINGLPRIADTFNALAHRHAYPELPTELERLSRLVSGRGACKHPDGTVRLVRSSLRMFTNEVNAHLAGRCIEGGGHR
jgi:NADH:ubiquinone oxidoreductase subunit F (NADH-binding)